MIFFTFVDRHGGRCTVIRRNLGKDDDVTFERCRRRVDETELCEVVLGGTDPVGPLPSPIWG